jgi:hypothetical protein
VSFSQARLSPIHCYSALRARASEAIIFFVSAAQFTIKEEIKTGP